MCYEADAEPPFHGEPVTTVDTATVTLNSAADGAPFQAFAARPADFGEMSGLMAHLIRLTREGLYGDIDAALGWLRAEDGGRLISLGFCFGGRTAFLTAQRRFGLDGVVGLYGFPGDIGGAPGPQALAAELTAPILGLFGGADEGIPPSTVDSFDRALTEAGTPHEFVTYPGAPHGFFDTGLPGFAAESADAWRRILAFAALPGPASG